MPDVVFRPAFLTEDQQRRVVEIVHSITPGFYVPRTRWGQAMRLQMLCLGLHWSARDYKYHPVRKDVDALPCPPIPDELQQLARRALLETDYVPPSELRPFDTCIVNRYAAADGGRLGDHVDNSEGAAALASGYPVVSISIGASCVFRLGGPNRTDPYQRYTLASGDLLIFGRSMRLAHHGVSKLLPDTTPPQLGLEPDTRLNLTFRIV